MGKVRVVTRADGGVSIIHPIPKSKRAGESEAEWLDRVFSKSMNEQSDLTGRDYEDVEDSEIPEDRKYREAWRKETGKAFKVDATIKAEIDARPTPE